MFYKLWIVFVFTIILFYKNVHATTKKSFDEPEFSDNESKTNEPVLDSIAKADEHHKIVILVPHILEQKKKNPKTPHKVVPVVHSGKVIHAHHHHGKVDHLHGHSAKAKHQHKHYGTAGHKHSHFGAGMHSHKHLGKAAHEHKHEGQGTHKHAHSGKGTIHHVYSKHHNPKPPPKKYWNNLKNYDENVDTDFVKILRPSAAASSSAFSNENVNKIIHIRIPHQEDESNDVQEVDINSGYEIPSLQGLQQSYLIDDDPGRSTDNLQYVANIDELIDHVEPDSDSEYQLGDGYRLAASAAAKAAVAADFTAAVDDSTPVEPAFPYLASNNRIAFSDTFHYQY